MSRLPNFLIIGAAKSGTTSLANYCQQHPDIFMTSPKEPNFFYCEGAGLPPDSGPASGEVIKDRLYHNSINNLEAYLELFAQAGDAKILSEASVRYLYYPGVANKIHHYLPEVKMVAILRNPVDRIYSHYLMNIRHLLEPLSLEEAIAQESQRIANHWGYDWHYVRVSKYYEQIQYYWSLFSPEQVKVILFEELVKDPLAVMKDLYLYLDVDPNFVPNLKIKLEGYYPKSMVIQRLVFTKNPVRSSLEKILPPARYNKLLNSLRNFNKGKSPELALGTRTKLSAMFREDNEKLANLIGKEIPW